MRALVVSIWVFINLVFLGMCGYMYLLWSQYWMYVDRQNPNSGSTMSIYDQQIYYYNHGYPNETLRKFNTTALRSVRKKHSLKENNTVIIKNSRPRFPNLQDRELQLDSEKLKCLDQDNETVCETKIFNYKTQLLYELRRVLMDESNVFKSGIENQNPYNVHYKGPKNSNKSVLEMLCDLSKMKVRTLKRNEQPFNKMPFGKYLPKRYLLENKWYNSCAVIASAGSLKGSNLGALIDSHNLVLRFNHAPTKGFERDVGKKTTIRIVNSQVIAKDEFGFVKSDLYKNITILAWDPSNYNETLRSWYEHPDFNMFPNFAEYRIKNPKSKLFLLDPRSLWALWDFLQSNTSNRLRRNPPSSGFLGFAVLLPYCNYVDVFEYVPSIRVTKKCHYYDEEDNPACTFGIWHPLAAEKLLAYTLNIATDKDVFQNGFIRIPGFKKLNC